MAYPRHMPTEWTAAMVAALPDDGKRYEVLDGELVVMPAPCWNHQFVALAFWKQLDAYSKSHSLGRAIAAPADVEFSQRRLLQPDVFVVPYTSQGAQATAFADVGRLLLAVEVRSPSTARRDRGIKRRIYLEEHIDEYWIVDADAWSVERWKRGEERPEVVMQTLVWEPEAAVAPLEIDLPKLFEDAMS
ncbi:MAG: Uma2 family endonuclease [Gemmatimonadaceae bacterium]